MIVRLAQKLGEQLANTTLNWQFFHKNDTVHYTTLQLIPYKHLEDSISGRYGVLRSFVGSKAKIYCTTVGNKHEVKLLITVPKHLLPTLEASLYTNIKHIDIKMVDTPTLQGLNYAQGGKDSIDERLHDQDFKKDGSYLDPFMDILALFEQISEGQLLIQQCIDFDMKEATLFKKIGGMIINSFFGDKTAGEPKDDKQINNHLTINATIGYHISGIHKGHDKTVQSAFGKLTTHSILKRGPIKNTLSLQLSQIINCFHLPSGKIIDNLTYLPYRKLQAPNTIVTLESIGNKNDLTVIGRTEYRGSGTVFGITREDKLRHMYIIGKTGVGKSNLIANLARSDMVSNKGICVLDPHGDLIDDIIAQVPSYRINDVVLFDVADRERPVGFNVLEYEKPEEKPLIASGIVSIFKKLFGNSRGPRLEYILRNTLLSILEYPNATLMHVLRMLTDDNFREEVLEYVKDPMILKFWRDEFDSRQPKQKEEAIAPISNKVGQFTSSQIIRNIFGQSKSKINFRRLMDEGKIVLINLSKGKIGEDSTNLLGSFIVSKIQIDAMSRADMDESQRKDFYLYIDEFQNFATESFATILSEARKYKLGLIVANQYSSQLDEITRGAIFGNVGSIISMTLGYDDAVIMANQFKSMVSANDFLDIPKYKAYIKLMIHGTVSDPFTMQTIALPPGDDVEALKEKIRTQSRNRYAISRVELEELIKVRAERSFSKTEKAVLKAKEQNKSKGIKEIEVKKVEVKPDLQKDATSQSQELQKVPVESQPLQQQEVVSPQPTLPTLNFSEYQLYGTTPDALLYDTIKGEHKRIFYSKPETLDAYASLNPKKPKGGIYMKGAIKVYKVYVDMYEPHDAGLTIWVGSKQEVDDQIKHGFTNAQKWVLVPNDSPVSSQSPQIQPPTSLHNQPSQEVVSPPIDQNDSSSQGITEYAGIKVGKVYEGFVKLKYNYGIFITVGELDGLLHKSLIDVPEGVSRKKLYEIGDPIVAKAIEIKELDGRITVVRSQL